MGFRAFGGAQLTRARTKDRAKGRAGQAGRRQGAGHRAQGQGTEGRVGLQDSILRFSRFENLKNNIFATLGQGQGRRAGPRQGRAGCRAGAQAGCRAQGAGAGHKGQSRVARFHFEVFKA